MTTTTIDRSKLVAGLKGLIEEQNSIKITDADAELDIDSYTMMLVILFMKDSFGINLDMDSLDFDAFKSLNVLADIGLAHAG